MSKYSKFADDSKLPKVVNNLADSEILRDDVVKLQNWSGDWQVEFNSKKVRCIGKKSLNCEYNLNSITLKPAESERDLGVLVDESLSLVIIVTKLQIVQVLYD